VKAAWLKSRWFKIAAAALLLAALYRAADWRVVGQTLASLDLLYLAAALALFVPQTLLSAWRWRMLAQPVQKIPYNAALRHTAIAAAWNLIVPSKLGDLSKAALVPDLSAPQRAAVGGLVVIEKLADVAALCALILAGMAGERFFSALAFAAVVSFSAGESNIRPGLLARLSQARVSPRTLTLLCISTLVLWCLHLWQIELFMRAAGVVVPWQIAAARLPLAIFAGLLPVSFCGVGTRDAALVWLFADVAPAGAMAAVGLLTALRYLAPGAVGIAVLAAERERFASPAQERS
jgi:hypothetical protein